MKSKTLLLGLLALLMATNSYAFCIYNQTVGYDTLDDDSVIRNTQMMPTQILFKVYKSGHMAHMVVNQYDVLCELTDHREPTDATVVEIKWIKNISRVSYDNEEYNKSICAPTVYNKGGYVVVKGNAKSGFSCETYRD